MAVPSLLLLLLLWRLLQLPLPALHRRQLLRPLLPCQLPHEGLLLLEEHGGVHGLLLLLHHGRGVAAIGEEHPTCTTSSTGGWPK